MRPLRYLLPMLLAGVAHAEQPLPDHPLVKMQTNLGGFVLELDAVRAPLTVRHFLRQVQQGRYERTIFHRVIPGFVVQGGGYTEGFHRDPADETVPNESGNGLRNVRGTVAMARTGDPHSATSQFYINLADSPSLDPQPDRWGYAVFGRVIRGMETVDAIGASETGPGGPFDRDVPQRRVVLERVEIITSDQLEPSPNR